MNVRVDDRFGKESDHGFERRSIERDDFDVGNRGPGCGRGWEAVAVWVGTDELPQERCFPRTCASRIPNSLAEFGIEATLRGVWPPAPMPATGATRGNLRGFWGRGGRFGRGGGIARRGPAVGLTSGGVGPGDRRESRDNWPIMARYTAIERAPAAVDSRPIRRSAPVHLEFVGRPPRGAGPSPGSGRPNGHCSARHGPPCVRQRRSPACGPSTTRGCVHRWRRPDATQRCLDPGLSERIGNSRRTGSCRWASCGPGTIRATTPWSGRASSTPMHALSVRGACACRAREATSSSSALSRSCSWMMGSRSKMVRLVWPVRRMAPRSGPLARIRVRAAGRPGPGVDRGVRGVPGRVPVSGRVLCAGEGLGEGFGRRGCSSMCATWGSGRGEAGLDTRQPSGLIAENLLLKQQLIVLRRPRQRGGFSRRRSGKPGTVSSQPQWTARVHMRWRAEVSRLMVPVAAPAARRGGLSCARPRRPDVRRHATLPVRLEFPILSLNPGSRQRCVASGLLQRGTQRRVVEGPVRFEFPMLSLNPGLRPRGVAPDVWGRRVAGGGAAAIVEEAGRHAVRQRRMAMPLRWKTSRLLGSRRANAATNRQSAARISFLRHPE